MGWRALDEHEVQSNVDIAGDDQGGDEGAEPETEGEPEDELGTWLKVEKGEMEVEGGNRLGRWRL